MVSVIMTYYNTKLELLKEAIESVLNQTFTDVEFILVNDGSEYDKETDDYLKSLSDRTKLINNQTNQGHSEARNIGMDNASGEYLFFIDSDDYIYPDTLSTLFKNLTRSNADISIGNFTHSNRRDSEVVLEYTNVQALNILCRYSIAPVIMMLPKDQFNATWNKIYKRELFEGIRFPKGHTHDDTFTMHEIMWKANKIVFTPKMTYYYRLGGNIVNKYPRDMMLAHKARLDFVRKVGTRKMIHNQEMWFEEYDNLCKQLGIT